MAMQPMADDLVPVEALRSRRERFRCTVLAAVLTGQTCITRHTARHEGGRNQHTAHAVEWAKYPTCASCPTGAALLARVGVEVGPVCSVCGASVKGAKGRKPLCRQHRGRA